MVDFGKDFVESVEIPLVHGNGGKNKMWSRDLKIIFIEKRHHEICLFHQKNPFPNKTADVVRNLLSVRVFYKSTKMSNM